jgi:Domain of unknown function (DUF4113)
LCPGSSASQSRSCRNSGKRSPSTLAALPKNCDRISLLLTPFRFSFKPVDIREDYYSDSATLTFAHSSDNTAEILHYALLGCDRIFQPGQQFKKAGVLLLGLRSKSLRQLSLWEPDEERSDALMEVMDKINARFGRGSIRFAVAGLKKPWAMQVEKRSPRYTTEWGESPVVKA